MSVKILARGRSNSWLIRRTATGKIRSDLGLREIAEISGESAALLKLSPIDRK